MTHGPPRPPVRFGLGMLSGQAAPADRAATTEALQRIVDYAVAAEEAGFDSVWTTEHHFSDDGHLPAPLLPLAAVASRTSTITLGTNILLAPLHEPIRLAEDCAVLDHLSGGRVVLGLGAGYREVELAAFGVGLGERARKMREMVAFLRSAWAGQPVRVGGDDGPSVQIHPLPVNESGPPIWLGAFVEAGVRRARRIGDGFIAPGVSVRGARRRFDWLHNEAPLKSFAVAATMNVFVASDSAWELVLPGVKTLEDRYAEWLAGSPDHQGYVAPPIVTPPEHYAVGSPGEVIDLLRPWAELLRELPASCERHFIVRLTYPGLPDEVQRSSISLFGAEVAPALQEFAVRP